MIDIIDMLREMANNHTTTYDVRDDTVRVRCQFLLNAANEIERLRITSGEARSSAVLSREMAKFKEIAHD